jgi:hypothetical protein
LSQKNAARQGSPRQKNRAGLHFFLVILVNFRNKGRRMRKNRILPGWVALVLSLAFVPAAFSVPKYYEIAGGSVNANVNDPGLVVNTSVSLSLPGTSFTLNNGGSHTFNFFSIWTNETTVNPDDTAWHSISATLNFSDPLTGATVNGVTFGGSLLFGLTQWGQIQWNGPTTITLGDRVFSLSLSNEIFNPGLFGLTEGHGCGAIVKATVTQLSSLNGLQVPEQGHTALLLGGAFAGLVVFARKRVSG